MGLPEFDTHAAFEAALKKTTKLVVVDFYAEWCGPCKRIAPKIEELAEQKTNVRFYKVNVDDNEESAAAYKVSAMPTFLFIKDGKVVHTVVGADLAKITAGIEKYA